MREREAAVQFCESHGVTFGGNYRHQHKFSLAVPPSTALGLLNHSGRRNVVYESPCYPSPFQARCVPTGVLALCQCTFTMRHEGLDRCSAPLEQIHGRMANYTFIRLISDILHPWFGSRAERLCAL